MAGWISSLGKDSLVYGIGYGLSRFLQVIILPIIAGALTLSEFGYYSNYVIFFTFAAGFFVFGLDSAVARFFFDSDDPAYHRRLFSSSFFFILLVSCISVLALSFFPSFLLRLLDIPSRYASSIPFVLGCIPAFALNNIFLSWFKWNRQKVFFLLNSGGSIVLFLVPLLFISTVTFTVIFQVFFFSQLTVAAVSAFFARRYIKPQVSAKLLGALLVYGFPWFLVFLFGVSRTYLDRIFLSQYLSDEVYGQYNFSVRIATLIALVTTAFEMSFGPLAFRIWDKVGAPLFFARLQSIYVFIISVIACGITIVSPLVIQVLGGGKFSGSEKVLPLLLFAAIPVSLINFSNLGTVYAKKSLLSTFSLFIGFAAVMLFNFIFTHQYLQYGAAASSLAGHVLIVIAGYYFSRKYYAIPFFFLKDGSIFLLFLALSLLCVYFPVSDNVYVSLAAQGAGLLLLAFFFLITIYSKEYGKALSMVKGMMAGKLKPR